MFGKSKEGKGVFTSNTIMVKIFFIGEYGVNTGPMNVNQGIIDNLPVQHKYLQDGNKLIKLIRLLKGIFWCDVIVYSSGWSFFLHCVPLTKLLRKKIICIMHGCIKTETELNKISNTEKDIKLEEVMLEAADLLLPVSEKFMYWVCHQYPEYKNKTFYLYNGVSYPQKMRVKLEKNENNIVAVGGDRTSKNNIKISEAVERMCGLAQLGVYGNMYNENIFAKYSYTKYFGCVSQEELYDKMADAKLFVINSIFEPFSLAVFDALNCGCSVLISEEVGAIGLLSLEECDIIHDPTDVDEIERKIRYLLKNPNHDRIIRKVDYDKISCKQQVYNLIKICEDVNDNKVVGSSLL